MYTDDEIIRLCQQGRSEGFARLLEAYQGRVYRRAYSFLRNREDALDATQDVFLSVIKAIGHFRQGSPLWPWLRRLTTNTCLNRLRAAQAQLPTVPLGELWDRAETEQAEHDPERQALLAWDRAWLDQALQKLHPLHRMAVILRHQEGLSYEEIAQAMNLPLGTVKTYLFRARKALSAAMRSEHGLSGQGRQRRGETKGDVK